MNTFVLILMFLNGYNLVSSTTSVPGFKTRDECETAGIAVSKQTRFAINYVCVSQAK